MNNLEFVCNGEILSVSAEKTQSGFTVKSGEKEFQFIPSGENLFQTTVEGRRYVVAVVNHNGKYFIDIDSMLFEVTEPELDSVAGSVSGHEVEKDKIYAPMPGKIVKLQVAVGDTVVEKQPMVVVEAMKMENQVLSLANGKVKAIHFAEGDQVDTERAIIEIELDE